MVGGLNGSLRGEPRAGARTADGERRPWVRRQRAVGMPVEFGDRVGDGGITVDIDVTYDR
jgi:hypothetical protein